MKRIVIVQESVIGRLDGVRPAHNIRNPKSKPNPNRKTRFISSPKYKKYPNGSCKLVQNISKPERITRKTEKSEKISEETDPNVQNNIQYNYMKHEYILQIFNSYLF